MLQENATEWIKGKMMYYKTTLCKVLNSSRFISPIARSLTVESISVHIGESILQ